MRVFRDPSDYQYYLTRLAKYKKEHPFDLYHYCLMSNHTHLLVRTESAAGFAQFMKKLNLSYFHYYRQHYGWTGHFWQDRYKSQPVGKDAYFIQCGKYIELNPVRKSLVKVAEDYPYSSYRYYYSGRRNSLITTDIFYRELGKTDAERQARYNKLVVSEVVAVNLKKLVWSGSRDQIKNETEKLRYHKGRRKPKDTD